MMPKKMLFWLFCCLFSLRVFAQPEDYIFAHVDVTNGLSTNYITSIYKDKRGFMWFGTVAGLNRYDGYQFRVFRHDARNPHSVVDNYIEQIFEGPGGRMWVESRKQRFNLYDANLDRFDPDYCAYLRELRLPDTDLLTISPSVKGYWFVYRDSGVYHYINGGGIVAVRPSGGAAGPSGGAGLLPIPVATAKEDRNGDCWVVHEGGMLEKIDGRSHRVVFRSDVLVKEFGDVPVTSCTLFIDRDGDLWVSSNGVFKGTLYFRPSTREFRHLALDVGDRLLNSNIVLTALQDGKGLIWLATDHGGVDIIDKRTWRVRFVEHVEDDAKSIASNSIATLYRDESGTIWLGTYKSGISYYHQDNLEFPQYRQVPHVPGTLSYDDVNGFAEDGAGNIWIAANGGGLIYFDRKRNTFKQWLHDPRNPNSICSNILVNLLLDHEGKLWIATYFGGLDCFDGKTFTHYRHRDDDPYSLADDRVMCLCEDGEHQLWVGTLAAGMDRLDRRRKVFYHYRVELPGSIHNDYVSSIITDSHDNLWIGTGYGVDMIEKSTGAIYHYGMPDAQLSSDNVTWLFMDSQQRLWAGTREGLDVLNPGGKTFESFTTDDGLPDNTIRDILEDSAHRIWVSTPNGLSRITVYAASSRAGLRIHCRNFREQDGLQGREFNERSGLATRDGYFLFGGPNGFNIFRPEDIAPERKAPPIVLTGLEVFDRSVHVDDTTNGHVILRRALTETRSITLGPRDNVFSIEFASLGYIPNATNKYAYTLEGFNKTWLMTDGRTRKATYTNLDPGEYIFRVRATDEDGVWYDNVAVLKVVILPPWWKTAWAYAVYVLLLAGGLYLWRRTMLRRARVRFALEHERRETRRMHEMDLMKIRFFTNMSHELRTPLSLILAPVEKLLSKGAGFSAGGAAAGGAGFAPGAGGAGFAQGAGAGGAGAPGAGRAGVSGARAEGAGAGGAGYSDDPRQQYELIRRNARRLLHHVNQLLDFRKMEVNELKLHLREGDVVKFVRESSLSFADLADKKNIGFDYTEDCRSLITRFDHDKLERILFNLLSNAFKFTPENGSVRVAVTTLVRDRDVVLSIAIRDTGIGIPADKREKIFERFFQNEIPETMINQGSGIGLSITQEFVRMHQGRLKVESEVNRGSCFTVELPFEVVELAAGGIVAMGPGVVAAGPGAVAVGLGAVAAGPGDVAAGPGAVGAGPGAEFATSLSEEPADGPAAVRGGNSMTRATVRAGMANLPSSAPADAPTILLVEDNEDFRFYLKDNLRAHYKIVEASDGKEGWKKVLSAHPALVVSDISMPHMDGIELCKKILADERTCQTPVILLTAMTGETVELQGLQTGATDFISKPFNFEVLLSKIRNIVQHHATVRKTYQRQVQAGPAPVEPASADEQFLREVLAYIEKEMGNADLSVEELSTQFHTSRSTFYKRVVLLTGKTPVEFIRHIRLRRAAELLEKSQLNVAEIAYEVGFNNPKYFTHYFKAEFGSIPSAYRSNVKRTVNDA
ncbi:MAG TPA: two-component regulator propeller domain-containing protein [Puia sp.]|nr:two-component regulator propeller domain-containing protein [Puia sp.]